MVSAGSFRADLYYRLNVLPIRLPPLRERLADLEALVEAQSEDIARRSGLPARSVSPGALALLARRAWPGNIRELRNTLEQAALMTDDLVLEVGHFCDTGLAQPYPVEPQETGAEGDRESPPRAAAVEPFAAPGLRSLGEQVAAVERQAIAAALRDARGNRALAARQLGMSRAALYDRLARWPELLASS